MKSSRPPHSRAAGFTLVEVMISMAVVTIVMGMCMSTFLFGLRMMYKDSVRLQTNTNMRYFTAQMAKETVDASEFYLFADYTKLDGSVDIDNSDGTSDLAVPADDGNGTMLANGDCIVLVTRTTVETGGKVRQFRIYWRTVAAASVNSTAAIRYYESADYGESGTSTALGTLLNTINLNSSPTGVGRQITAQAKGRRVGATTNYYPIFCSEGPVVTATNESFSINAEFINGTSVTNMLSSSTFNYTVSPRR
jgi:prepilin-type N-terminal cleavage/methylation domain-containing protein